MEDLVIYSATITASSNYLASEMGVIDLAKYVWSYRKIYSIVMRLN